MRVLSTRPLTVLCLLGIGVSCGVAQKLKTVAPQEPVPTISVSTGVEVVLPQRWFNDIWGPFVSHSYSLTVRNDRGERVTVGSIDSIAGPKDPITQSQTVVYRARLVFEKTGNYEVETYFRGIDEKKQKKTGGGRWNLVVNHPTLATPLVAEPDYFYGESPIITFATREFPETHGYTYSVWHTGGGRVDTGAGPTIDLGTIVNDPDNTKKELEFEARGYYNGRLFSFLNPQDTVVHTSVSRFRVRRPMLDAIGINWDVDPETEISNLPVLPMNVQNWTYKPTLFGYVYLGRKGNSLIVTNAEISNLMVESDPIDFLEYYSEPLIGRVWTDIEIFPSRGFLTSGPRNVPRLVTLRFTFNTQLEDGVTRIYRALVY